MQGNVVLLNAIVAILCLCLCLRCAHAQSEAVLVIAPRRTMSAPHKPEEVQFAKNDLQVTVMASLLDVYVLNATNATCRRASHAYRDALINFEPWALKMLDASSKFQAGIISGNQMEFGAFEQCIHTETSQNGGVKGKHCTLSVLPSERLVQQMLKYRGITDKAYKNVRAIFLNTTYKWSICIPHVCGPEDVSQHFGPKIQQLFNGLDITFIDNVHCTTLDDIDTPLNGSEKAVMAVLIILVALVTASSCVEIYKDYCGFETETKGIESVFSIVANTRYIFKVNAAHNKMACLAGIRALSLVFVIVGHQYLLDIFYSDVNSFAFIDWVLKLSSQFVLRGPVAVDVFLLLSAILLTFNFLQQHETSPAPSVNVPMYYLHRYLRLTPSYALWILVVTTLGHRAGSGPLWEAKWRKVAKPCEDYWWSALLYTQNYVNPKEICILQSWYLSIDMFYYVVAPFLLLVVVKFKRLGFALLLTLIVTSIGGSFAKSWQGEYRVQGLLDSNLTKSGYFSEYYILPQLRASPYLIGIIFGYILYRTREKNVKMSPTIVILGWTVSSIVMATVMMTNRVFVDEDYEYDRFGNALYLSVHRPVFVLAVSWLVWACVNGYGGPVNRILSSHVLAILGKLTYSMYLVHMQYQFYDYNALKAGGYFSNVTMAQKCISDYVFSLVLGYLLTVMVELPIYRLSVMLFQGKRKENKN